VIEVDIGKTKPARVVEPIEEPVPQKAPVKT
jgi:hypothetical protein